MQFFYLNKDAFLTRKKSILKKYLFIKYFNLYKKLRYTKNMRLKG